MSAQPSPEQTAEAVSLPLYLTRFIGREQECATLSNLLVSQRLLALTGTGGIGKTRLAFQVAAQVATSFPDGLYVVELASIPAPELLPYAIAAVVGIRTDQDTAPLPLLIAALGLRHTLLLLDNCEHLLAGCAPLVEALLQSCPHLHILVTSREPLAVTGETIWRVVTLSSPPPTQTLSVAQLMEYEAIQLFCERAMESSPRFRLTPHNAAAVVNICAQLDGLPLALELAAALLPVFSVEQLAAQLNERFVLLRHGKRTAHTRQQTLQATLDWSYDLLTPGEQAVFAHLAVFAGSWSLDAVKQIVALPEMSDALTIEVLIRLVNKSLVLAEEQEGLGAGTTEVRYRLLDTMRMYTQEKLQQAGLWQQVCERHAGWYLHLAEQANEHLQGDDALPWFDLLEREMANFRAALTRLLANEQLVLATRLADALQRFWITRNHFNEGRHWFETLLTQENNMHQVSPALHARILFGASEFARYQGAYDRAIALLQEEMALLATLDDAPGRAEALTCLGIITGLKGDYAQGVQLCQRGLAAYRELDDQSGICTALTTLAFLTLAQGDTAQAIASSQEAIQRLRTAGHRTHLLYCLFTLAQAALFQDNRTLARTACQEAMRLAQTLQNSYGLAASMGLIAGLASLEGQPVQAARLFGAAQALQTLIKAPHPPAGRALLERMVLALRATLGAEAFLTHFTAGQHCPLEQILHEAEAILQPPAARTTTTAASPLSSILSTLSQREREILVLVATGLTDAQVADYLVLSPRTVSKHLQSIYTKLHINSRSAATRLAFEEGLL